MTNAVVHDFQERLEWSADLSGEPQWIDFYRNVWPDMIAAVRIDAQSRWQKWGVDRAVFLPGGKCFLIDEKKREKAYQDILLEEWSVCQFDWNAREITGPEDKRKVGWALDAEKQCDFVAYAAPALDPPICYLLPFELLRLCAARNLELWKQSSDCRYPVAAKNKGYSTVSIAVPWQRLKEALAQEMRRSYSGALPLPIPRVIEGGQLLLFEHGQSARGAAP